MTNQSKTILLLGLLSALLIGFGSLVSPSMFYLIATLAVVVSHRLRFGLETTAKNGGALAGLRTGGQSAGQGRLRTARRRRRRRRGAHLHRAHHVSIGGIVRF